MPFDESMVQYCAHGGMLYEEVEDAMNFFFGQKKKPDALFTSADKLTTNCLRYCKTYKIRIPQDVAVIGFSNLDLTELLSPALSVVRQPAFEMGRIAADLLIKMIESKRPVTDFETRILPAEVHERESSIRKKTLKPSLV
jgi:LacI family transcriptional regulator